MDIRIFAQIILNNNWQSLVKNENVEKVCATLKNLLVSRCTGKEWIKQS